MMLKKLREQKGAAAIEFAIILPLLLTLVFGIIEFGFLLYDKAMITNASREGARAGIVYVSGGISDAEIQTGVTTVVNNYCSSYLITFGASSTIGVTSTRAGGNLTVRVTYAYDFLVLPNFVTDIVGNINLAAQTIMRMEEGA